MSAQRIAKHLAVALGAVVFAYFARELRLSAFSARHDSEHYEDVYYLPPARFMKVLSLGFDAALADLLWCKALLYFGEGLAQHSALQHVFEYTDAMVVLDPSFRAPYRWIAMAATYRPSPSSTADGLRAATYLEQAVARWPTDGELRWDLGSLLRFDVAPSESDHTKKDAILERAAPHLAAAARLGAGPAWLVLNNASLLERLGRTEQAIRHLEEAYATLSDEDLRAEVARRLARLRNEAFDAAQQTADANFEAARKAQYPFLSPDAFLLMQAPTTQTYDADVVGHFLPTEMNEEPQPAAMSDEHARDGDGTR